MSKKENLNENNEDLVSVIAKTIIKKVNVSEPINEAKAKTTADKHMEKIAKDVLKNPEKARILGPYGPEEARKRLKSLGYSDKELDKLSEENLPEETELDESFIRIKSKSVKDMVMDLKYALEIAERWAKGNDVDRNLLRGMEKTLSDQLKVLRSDVKTFNRKEDVPKEYMAEDTQLDERVLPIFQKTHDELKSLEMKLKPGSRLNAGINRELNGNYNSDFAKMSKLLTPLVETWEFVVWNDLQMNLVRENTELDEAVNVSYDRYVRVHGKKPKVSGRAPFMFTSKSMGAVSFDDDTEVLMTPTMTAADAQKLAKEWGKKHGHRTVYFMESLEKSIEDLKKKPNDEEELKESVKIKNNTKSSDFIKILRAIAKDDLDARQFLNKLADHIKKSYSNTISDKDIQSLKRIPALQRLWDDDTLDYVLISSGLDK